jgi:hypothetical protein
MDLGVWPFNHFIVLPGAFYSSLQNYRATETDLYVMLPLCPMSWIRQYADQLFELVIKVDRGNRLGIRGSLQ